MVIKELFRRIKGIASIVLIDKVVWTVFICWFVFQVILCLTLRYDELVSDPGFYVYYAQECVARGTMYPDYESYHNEYIFSPGFINFLILWIRYFGSVDYVPFFNVLLNVAILFFLYKISIKVFNGNKKRINLVLIIFMLLPSNSTIVHHMFTELPFEFLSMASFYLVLTKKNKSLLIAGVLVALAHWVRPLGTAWIIAALIYLFCKPRNFSNVITYVLGIFVTLSSISYFTHKNFPDYLCQPVTGGVNLVMGANDKATGGYCGEARREKDGLAYLPGLFDSTKTTKVKYYLEDDHYTYKYSNRYTYKECDSIYKARAINWILKNPAQWIMLIPHKIYMTYHTAPSFANTFKAEYQNSQLLCIIQSGLGKIGRLFFLFFLISLIGLFTPFWKKKEHVYIVMPIIIGTAMTAATCGVVRYNFIFIPFLLIFSVITIEHFYNKLAGICND